MDIARGRILVVDDEPINLQIMRHILKEHCNAAYANNGSKAIELAEKIKPDLILLDVMMPEMDGFEVCSLLKKNPETAEIPVIFLTAKVETEDLLRGFTLGAVDYITKPFRKEELLARVKTHIRLRQAEEALRCALSEAEEAKMKAESALQRNLQMQEKMHRDLEAGARMQKKFLTGQQEALALLQSRGYRFFVYNSPFTSVSGDFFYPRDMKEHGAGFFFADTCGHGLPAALISMRILGLLQSLARCERSPQAYLEAVNQDICDVMPPGNFITAAYLIFSGDRVCISNAGNPLPFILSQGKISEIDVRGMPLGIISSPPLSEQEWKMKTGDRLILYSDGIIESKNTKGEMLGKEGFRHFLMQKAGLDSKALRDAVPDMLSRFSGGEAAEDDITMIIIEKK